MRASFFSTTYDAERRHTVTHRNGAGGTNDGKLAWETGNGYDIQDVNTFAVWLKGSQTSWVTFAVHFETNIGRKYIVYRPHVSSSDVSTSNRRVFSIHGEAGDFDEGEWVRLERNLLTDAQIEWPTITEITRITGTGIWSPSGTELYVDGLSFSNSLTTQHNVLGGGSVGHILTSQNIDTSDYSYDRDWYHYDQVGSVMGTSDPTGFAYTPRRADAFGNTQASWSAGTWVDTYTDWGHNTKEMDGDIDMVYMYQRWYDSKLGLFASMTPLQPYTEKQYQVFENNPIMYKDETGLKGSTINDPGIIAMLMAMDDPNSPWCLDTDWSGDGGVTHKGDVCFRNINTGDQFCYNKDPYGTGFESSPDKIVPANGKRPDGSCRSGILECPHKIIGHIFIDVMFGHPPYIPQWAY